MNDKKISSAKKKKTIQKILGSNSEIATKLQQFYHAIQDEPIPERFLELLDKLDQAEDAVAARPHEQEECETDPYPPLVARKRETF